MNTFRPSRHLTFEERVRSFPPVLVRLLATKNGRPMDAFEIGMASDNSADGSGWLAPEKVEFMSYFTSWSTIHVADMVLFTRGCGVDFCNGNCRRADEYLRVMSGTGRNTFAYLAKHPRYKEFYLPLMVRWRKAYPADPPDDLWPPVRKLLVRLTPLLKK